MAMLPGWNSIEAVGSIGQSLHIAAMVVLALLVVAEGMALTYDNRKYALIGAVEDDAIARRDQEQREAEARYRSELAGLQEQLKDTQRQQASRRLSSFDQQTLITALSPFSGQQLEISSILGDFEAQEFASDFVSVAAEAGWIVTGVDEASFTTNPVGVDVLYREPPPDNVPPPSLTALVDALVSLHILPARSVTIFEDLAPNVIRLIVGTKPAAGELHSFLSQQPAISNESEAASGTGDIGTPPRQ